MIAFKTAAHIARPIEEVFAYVSDPLNFRRWNSAVRAVRKTAGPECAVGATYSMERQLATGRAENELEIVVRERPSAFAIQTTSGPTPFLYRYSFIPENGGTVIRLDASIELEGAAALLVPLVRGAVKRGVDENLAALKQVLETSGPRGSAPPSTAAEGRE